MTDFRKMMLELKAKKEFCIFIGWIEKAHELNSEMVQLIHENTQKNKLSILWGRGMEKFFNDKNIITDILEEIEKEQNKKIDDVLKNIYIDILTDEQLKELKKCYPLTLLDSYTKDRRQKFDILDREGFRSLIEFIYNDRVKTVINMVVRRLVFNFYTDLNVKNKTLLKEELKKLI